MHLKVTSIVDAGNHTSECIVMEASDTCELSHYLLFDGNETRAQRLVGRLRDGFAFPRKAVERGDFVVLYTKPGEAISQQVRQKNGKRYTCHSFYWGLSEPIWQATDNSAHLLHVIERQNFLGPSETGSGYLPIAPENR